MLFIELREQRHRQKSTQTVLVKKEIPKKWIQSVSVRLTGTKITIIDTL